VVATEKPFVGGYARTTASQHKLSSVVETICQERGIGFVQYAPATVKKALTGNGRATKEQVQRAVRSAFGFDDLTEHVADAVGLGAVALSREGKQ
jgi:crossover junction endodeoxyribonuclease RuvC